MERRDFLKAGVVAAGGTLTRGALAACEVDRPAATRPFKLNYAPHFGMFKHVAGNSFLDQIEFAADQGFTAWEDRAMKARPTRLQQAIARTMESAGMQMGAFEATPPLRDFPLIRPDNGLWEGVLRDIRESVEVAKRVNAKWMTVVLPGRYDVSCDWGRQRAHCIELLLLLKRCCQILEPHDLVIVLETAGGSAVRPAEQAYQMCKAVGSPACKILFDICQRQNTQRDLISSIDHTWSEIGYFHCRDNPGRQEPGTGTSDYRHVFRHLHSRGFSGIVGMEHGNTAPGCAGDLAVVESYVQVDRF